MSREPASTRKVVAAALVLLVLGAIGAVRAGLSGDSFMYDLEQDEPALSRTAPMLDPSPTPRLARRVFVVIVDGLRLDKSHALPFLDDLRRRGVDSEASSHYPTWSKPNYVSILTGVPPRASGVRTNYHVAPVTLDSIMDRAHAARLRVATATDYGALPQMFLSRLAPPVAIEPPAVPHHAESGGYEEPVQPEVTQPDAEIESSFDDARYVPWAGGFSQAGSAIVAANNAELVIMLIGAVDIAGHAHGGASPQYREATIAVDRALARALGKIDLTKDAVIIVADHGHTNSGGHGGLEPEVVGVPLIAAGAGIRRGATASEARLVDVAPTVAALLGIAAPGHGLGRTLVEIVELDSTGRALRAAADATRLSRNGHVVSEAEEWADSDVLEYRALRIAIVVAAAALAIMLASFLVRRRVLALNLRTLIVSVPSFLVVYYALIATLGQRFSPSLVPSRGHLAWALLQYGVVGIVVQLAASLWALRVYRTLAERLAAANGIAWLGFMLTMVPAGVIWAYFPAPYMNVPDPLWLVVIPAVEVAVACAAITSALMLGLELIVFVARAYHVRAPALTGSTGLVERARSSPRASAGSDPRSARSS
jgi:type I phosphodiesterase/nucleotide pyrophosphatase